MGRILDFKKKYDAKVLSLDPSFSEHGGFGWGIINLNAEVFGGNKNVPIIHRSGLIKPFSSESNLMTMKELCEKVLTLWRHDAGYSKEPLMLVIEQPEIYPGSPVKFTNLTDLSILVGMLINTLCPQITLIPWPREWKGNKKKSDTKDEIENLNDHFSSRALTRDLDGIAIHIRHNVYDALGLGIYGAHVFLGKQPKPRLFLKAAS